MAYSICWAVMFYGQAFSFCNTVWVVFLEEYTWRTRVALSPEVQLCTAYANIVDNSKLKMYKPDKLGVFIIPCFSARSVVDNIPNQPICGSNGVSDI
jgi:hypothetical protein